MTKSFDCLEVYDNYVTVRFKLFYEDTELDYDQVEDLYKHLGKILQDRPKTHVYKGERLTWEELKAKRDEINVILGDQ